MPTTTNHTPLWSDAPGRNRFGVHYRHRGTEIQRSSPAGDGWVTYAIAEDAETADYITKCLAFFAPHQAYAESA